MIATILTRISLLGCLLFLFGGCSSIGYLAHTAGGHLELMGKREPINRVLQRKDLDAETRDSLLNIQNIRAYASEELKLPDNKSYTQYVELERDYVTWVVFAAPEFSLQPVTWCFWVVGCVPYRGYFEPSKATKFADQLSAKGLEVYVSPVTAYSTLGWFSDPVLSSMLGRGKISTSDTIVHELAHQQLYFKDDTEFNEAFATAVARAGVRDWLHSQGKAELLKRYERSNMQKDQLYSQIQQLRDRLIDIYRAETSKSTKRQQKTAAYEQYRQEVRHTTKNWQHGKRYQRWVLQNLNNAKLSAISTYQELTADFLTLLAACDRDYEKFYKVVESMRKLKKMQRRKNLSEAKCTLIVAENDVQ